MFLFACSKARHKESMVSTDAIELEAAPFVEEEILKKVDFEKNITQLNPLIKQKLQEYYDLLALEKANPEFTNEIKVQLKKLSDIQLELDSTINQVKIEDILFLSSIEKVSDSIQKVKFSYNNGSKTDSLTAIIKTTPVKVDDQTIWNTQVLFEKN
jgi:hypothetical protein